MPSTDRLYMTDATHQLLPALCCFMEGDLWSGCEEWSSYVPRMDHLASVRGSCASTSLRVDLTGGFFGALFDVLFVDMKENILLIFGTSAQLENSLRDSCLTSSSPLIPPRNTYRNSLKWWSNSTLFLPFSCLSISALLLGRS